MCILNLCDGQIIVTYDPETFEVLTIQDSNGNDAPKFWNKVCQDSVNALRSEEEFNDASTDRYLERSMEVYMDLKKEGY